MSGKLSNLPIELVLHILSFSNTYIKEGDFINRNGKFIKRISKNDPRKEIISKKLKKVVIEEDGYDYFYKRPIFISERQLGVKRRLTVREDFKLKNDGTRIDCIMIIFQPLSHISCDRGQYCRFYLF
jgi:hypothetical protein